MLTYANNERVAATNVVEADFSQSGGETTVSKPTNIQEQRDRLKAEFGDKSEESDRSYRKSMTLTTYTLQQRFELGLLNPGAYCQLALEMDEIGKAGPEVFDVEDFIDRWKVETGVVYNKKTKQDEVKYKRLNPAVVNRELLRLEKVTKSSIVQELKVEIDYNQGYDE
jgi:hypothetical protein